MTTRAPLGARLFLKDRPDWDAVTVDDIAAGRAELARMLRSPVMRPIAGRPDRRARIEEHVLDLPGRRLTLRVHRPERGHDRLPLVLSFHGGGFITGTAAQNDWLNSGLAAALPAVVVAVFGAVDAEGEAAAGQVEGVLFDAGAAVGAAGDGAHDG